MHPLRVDEFGLITVKQKNISKLLSADEFYFPILNHCALAIWSNKRKKNGVKIANNSRSFSSMLSHFLSQQSAKLVTDWIYPKLGFFFGLEIIQYGRNMLECEVK